MFYFFFFNDTATTEIYTLSLHDALPIYHAAAGRVARIYPRERAGDLEKTARRGPRSEEHTSELQSRFDLVCRLLLEKKKKNQLQRQIVQMSERNQHKQVILYKIYC